MDSLSSLVLLLYIQLCFSTYTEHVYKQALLSENTGNGFWMYVHTMYAYNSDAYEDVVRRTWMTMKRIQKHSDTCSGMRS